MHGDLNLRNIMARLVGDKWTFKLIDIDRLTLQGDFAYDIGELLVDAQITLQEKEPLSGSLANEVVEHVRRWKDNEPSLAEDTSKFEARLALAKARSLTKSAKINISHRAEALSLLDMTLSELQKCMHSLKTKSS
jgi:hypothetical protein